MCMRVSGESDLLEAQSMFESPLTRYAGQRVSNTGVAVWLWSQATGQQPTYWDFCSSCAEQARAHPERYAQVYPPRGRDEPVGEAIYQEEPSQPQYDTLDIRCEICGCLLGDE